MDNVRYEILLIENNELDQMAFKCFVEDNALPYDCTISGSVSEAKRVLGTDQFDIIITDHSLGDGTALEVLDLAGNTPVIVVTGAGDEETAIKAWESGAYDYLVKDVNQNYLKAIPMTVENAVRQNMVEKKIQLLKCRPIENRTMDSVRYKILLIEDNELDQMAFKRLVKNNALPYDCTVSCSVSEARRVLGTDQFDIIITDHSLGDGTALEVLDLAGNTPVIVVTGAGNEETAIKAWKAGAYDYLVKDVSQNYLKAIPLTVENAVRHNMMEKKLQLLLSKVPPNGE